MFLLLKKAGLIVTMERCNGFNAIKWLHLSTIFATIYTVCLVSGLKNVELKLPAVVSPGDTVTLICLYDLEGEPLYTVKWYKGNDEFYRYIPKEHPNTLVFPLPDINVDMSKSGYDRVVLMDVSHELAGKYRCEVSADFPNFDTKVVTNVMTVADKLERDPDLMLEKYRYSNGDILKGNCSSPAHLPPANVTILLNDRQIKPSFVYRSKEPDDRLVTRVGFEHKVTTSGKLNVTCVADLYRVLKTKTEFILEEDSPVPASVLGTRQSTPVGGGCQSCYSKGVLELASSMTFAIALLLLSR